MEISCECLMSDDCRVSERLKCDKILTVIYRIQLFIIPACQYQSYFKRWNAD